MANEAKRAKEMRRAVQAHSPLMPTAYEAADALSIKRVFAGTATMVEQKRAFEWIMRATGYVDEPFRPGSNDETIFALGKAHVGREIAKLLNIDMSIITRGEREANG